MKELLALIRRAETSDRYDVAYGFKKPNHKSLTDMTLNEVRAYQEGLIDGGSPSSAVGAYQFIARTLAGLMSEQQRTGLEQFSHTMQDVLAMSLLCRRGLDDFKARRMDARQFAHRISQEWASFPNVIGKGRGGKSLHQEASYYSGDGLNHARVSVAEVMDVLKSPDTMEA